ncbi:TPA: CPBP family intramembrane metalloprotease [Streptococcus suis]|uniref:CPBP family intramembrane glutamic endopeptidase n=1 Tax=Streptococcus suis TaxID=1307 RepID=A0AAW9DHB0_STRSU|nr:CPBP family glutamic-type intramembrane protease [Streptococcus suis]MDX5038034.1 CPBP family intramembrane glutamic endopeptidase [Streptococcus suis]NQN17113.1 CPBP family intramembrane metalloprotease [Streptococcus suis]HEL1757970.1 CPBP family intramembrane metalloprotease [Streptococcus suis]HEL1759669.1 CPBP family intramembrane metalloprotease [Streptococcus suis]HEL2300814.1 CPBP family intramembrane metalloprotease [Streptococcus suis]
MKKLKKLVLADYSGRLLLDFVLAYALLRGNGLLVLLLPRFLSSNWTVFFQLCYFLGLSYLAFRLKWMEHKDFKRLPKDGYLITAVMLLLMFSSATVSSLISHHVASNQENVLALLEAAPVIAFATYLMIASILEEIIFRGILFGLSEISVVDIVLTSMLFAVIHQPDNFLVFASYLSLGLCLGYQRYKVGLGGSMLLHVLWNLLVLVYTLFV